MKDDEHEEYTWGSQISALDGRYLFLWVFRDTELVPPFALPTLT